MTDDNNQHSRPVFSITKEGVLLSTHSGAGAAARAVERHSNIQNRGGLKGDVIKHISALEVGQDYVCRGIRCQRVDDTHEPGVIDPAKQARRNPIPDE